MFVFEIPSHVVLLRSAWLWARKLFCTMTVLAQVRTCLCLTMLAGFAGDLHCSLVRPHLLQHLLKGKKQLPASPRQCFLARDWSSTMVSLSLLGQGSPGWQDIASQDPDMFLPLMPLPPKLCLFPALLSSSYWLYRLLAAQTLRPGSCSTFQLSSSYQQYQLISSVHLALG